MAESQLVCMDDEHVNEKVPESRPEFYYSEEQRAALEQLLRSGDGAFKMRLKEDNIKDFLCAKEVKVMRETFQEYDTDSDSEPGGEEKPREASSADSGVHSTYWPQMSDTEVPSLDIGWPASSGVYKGVTRVSVYTHPPKEPGPHIKEVVRRLIQGSHKVVAIVMDLLTDLQILQDLLDASSRRGVAVYVVLEARGVPHFLDMCSRLQINGMHLRNLRVRMVRGAGLALSFGKLPGSLTSKYMLVDGEKVMFGSYSFTWSSSRLDRSTVTVMTGQIVDFFDSDFREMYAVSEQVDLYKEFSITKPPLPTPILKPKVEHIRPLPVSMSRFQVSVGDSRQTDLKVPAHKYHNPKYSLVFGNSLGLTGSLQDLSTQKDSLVGGVNQRNGLQNSFLHTSKDKTDRVTSPSPSSTTEQEDKEGKGSLKKNEGTSVKKPRSSFRHFLKGRGANQNTETIEEGVVTPQSPAATSQEPETNGVIGNELEDSFEILDKPGPLKLKTKKPSKHIQRSVSLQTINTGDEDGLKSRRRHQKKNCIQS
ncbi:PREDICTED: protein FAM83F-like [Cyprinodon variegatus]|uniref:Family with sequence similarity 83 member Fa n=1 Tax=Cyprinodon variegatus TaxID=28743 RepID=A0A3Q2C8P9_CYPVA|nr:PREDICTED: protein FAM83F-like [Cyprinodon variegatus]